MLCFKNYFHSLDTSPLFSMCFAKYYVILVVHLFILIIVSFALLKLNEDKLIRFYFRECSFSFVSKKIIAKFA